MAYAPRFFRKLACLTKIEATYGVDSAPAVADAILMANVTFRPLVAQRLTRDLLLPYLGNQGVILTGMYATIEGDIELAGSGAAGTPPRWGSVMRIGGMTETIEAGVGVTYERADYPQDSGTIHFVMDGVQHVLLGSRANLAPSWSTSALPRMRSSITGLLGTVTTVANPAVSKTGWITPLPVNKANTTLSLHGWSAVGSSLSLDLGNTVTPRFLIGDEAILITNQQATGSVVIDAPPLATFDPLAIAKARTRGVLDFQHGTVAGNIIDVTASAVELGEPQPGESDGVLINTIALDVCVTDGFDDLTIVAR